MEIRRSQIRLWAERGLLLVSAPLAIALIANIATNFAMGQTVAGWLWIIMLLAIALAIFLYAVVYTHILDDQLARFEKWSRARKFGNPRVLVLDGTLNGDKEEKPASPTQSNKAPLEWRSALKEFGWNVEIGPIQHMWRGSAPDMIVNPFGERYPEANFQSLPIASKIREYVWEGGVYVNVAGIPFWYCYDPKTGVADVAGRMEKASDGNPKWKSLFHDLFPDLQTSGGDPQQIECRQAEIDAQRFGDIANAGNDQSVVKFRAYPGSSGQMIPMLRESNQEFYIMGVILFGQGCFLFAGVKIDDSSTTFAKVVAAIKGWADYESQSRKP